MRNDLLPAVVRFNFLNLRPEEVGVVDMSTSKPRAKSGGCLSLGLSNDIIVPNRKSIEIAYHTQKHLHSHIDATDPTVQNNFKTFIYSIYI